MHEMDQSDRAMLPSRSTMASLTRGFCRACGHPTASHAAGTCRVGIETSGQQCPCTWFTRGNR